MRHWVMGSLIGLVTPLREPNRCVCGVVFSPGGVLMGLLDLGGAFGEIACLAYPPWAGAAPSPLSHRRSLSFSNAFNVFRQ